MHVYLSLDSFSNAEPERFFVCTMIISIVLISRVRYILFIHVPELWLNATSIETIFRLCVSSRAAFENVLHERCSYQYTRKRFGSYDELNVVKETAMLRYNTKKKRNYRQHHRNYHQQKINPSTYVINGCKASVKKKCNE